MARYQPPTWGVACLWCSAHFCTSDGRQYCSETCVNEERDLALLIASILQWAPAE